MSHRIAMYKGKPIWSGVANTLDYAIEEAHPFSTARDEDFHHSLYISTANQEKMDNGEAQFFWIAKDDDGKTTVQTAWRDSKNEALEKALKEALDLSDTRDYDDEFPEYENNKLNNNVVDALKDNLL